MKQTFGLLPPESAATPADAQVREKKKPRFFFREPQDRPDAGIDRLMLLWILLLAVYGSLMVFSASTAYAEIRFSDAGYFIRKQTVWLLIGIGAMAITASVPIGRWKKIAVPLYFVTLGLLALVPIVGSTAGGAKRWIAIGSFTFQPSELAKTALVLILAYYFSVCHDRIHRKKTFGHVLLYEIVIPFLWIGGICALVVLEKHLSCIIIVGLIGLSMMFLAGSHAGILGALCGCGGAGVGIFAFAVDYTRRRITIWRNPELFPRDGGWQTLQGLMAIGSGGFWGLGPGKSRLKYLYVSEPQNDFIFTVLCEEVGFAGAAAALGLFALFVARGFHIAAHTPDPFAALVVSGLTLKVAVQVLLNIAVITNTLPNTGISLPFFSYGGSSLVMLFAEMGILLAASRTSHIKR